jgi:hypothetical protein
MRGFGDFVVYSDAMKHLILSCLAALLLMVPGGLASADDGPGQIVLQDPLTNGETVGTIVGGELTDRGYTASQPQSRDHILYRLPRTIRHGQITFEAHGVRPNPNNANHDPALLGMYDGTGIDEPIAYFNNFKQNHFRFNVHVRSDRNVFKSVITAAHPTPENLNAERAVFPGSGKDTRDWTVESNGPQVEFAEEDRWERFRLEWGPLGYALYRDDERVWKRSIAPSDPAYAPRDHRLWLGSAPAASSTKYTTGSPPFTFRNLEVRDLDANPMPEPGSLAALSLLGGLLLRRRG